MYTTMPQGFVQFFLFEKGYGYIRIPETREEFYVHKKQLLTPIQKGDLVSFEIGEDKQGMFAKNVSRVKQQDKKSIHANTTPT